MPATYPLPRVTGSSCAGKIVPGGRMCTGRRWTAASVAVGDPGIVQGRGTTLPGLTMSGAARRRHYGQGRLLEKSSERKR